MQTSWIVDENGEAWLEGSADLERHLGAGRYTDTVSGFLLKKAGFARVTISRLRAHVQYCDNAVSAVTLIGVMHMLADRRIVAVTFQDPENKASTRLFPTRSTWLAHIGVCIEQRQAINPRTCRSIPSVMSPFRDRLAAARQIVLSLSDAATRDRILNSLFSGMFILARLEGDRANPVCLAFGSQMPKYDPALDLRGSKLADGPDGQYGTWIEAHYRRAWERAETETDDVDAYIRWSGKKPILHRYTRAIIPMLSATQDRLVLSVTAKRL
jgi:hypothetical protein